MKTREGGGPVLIECKTYRYRGHSEHDPALYRDKEELMEWQSRDPIPQYEFYLEKKGHELKRIREEDGRARALGGPGRGRFRRAEPDAQARRGARGSLRTLSLFHEHPLHRWRRQWQPPRLLTRRAQTIPTPNLNCWSTMEVTYLKAINQALHEEMRRDDNVFVMGEDVGELGGAFKVTEGLLDAFGEDRVIDTPISEALIVGAGVGAAMLGMRPVLEMQFGDFISCAFDQIVNTAATLRYRHGGRASCPLVMRAPSGAGVHGALFHSQNPEAWFTRVPGLKVVAPATPYDAKGLLKSAVRDDNPVIYFEHKRLYRSIKEDLPEGDFTVPIGAGRTQAGRPRPFDNHLRRHDASVARRGANR